MERIHDESSRLLQSCLDEDLPKPSLQAGHLDSVGPLVTPEEVPAHPVHSEPVRVLERDESDGLLLARSEARVAELGEGAGDVNISQVQRGNLGRDLTLDYYYH